MDKCWAESYCNGYPNYCGAMCEGHAQLYALYAQSHMPKKYQYDTVLEGTDDFAAFTALNAIKEDVVSFVQNGGGLFIQSVTKGNGKTSWACKIMNYYFRKIALTNNLECRGVYVNVPEFLQRMRDDFDEEDPDFREYVNSIFHSDLVLWDDIGTECPTNWTRERLYTFINHREANMKSQIFTSNLLLSHLEEEKFLGSRIVSRIYGQCEIVKLVGRDRRRYKNG